MAVAQARSKRTSSGSSARTRSSCSGVVVEEKMRITIPGKRWRVRCQAATKARVSSTNWPTGVQRSHWHWQGRSLSQQLISPAPCSAMESIHSASRSTRTGCEAQGARCWLPSL